MTKGVIFVSGIHGVGKSTLCAQVSDEIGIPFLSASTIIKEFKLGSENIDKLNAEVMSNAKAFNSGVKKLLETHDSLIVDGHTILLDDKGEFIHIPPSIIAELPILKFITLYHDLNVVSGRLSDDLPNGIEFLREFQDRELNQSLIIAQNCSFSLEYFHAGGAAKSLISMINELHKTA